MTREGARVPPPHQTSSAGWRRVLLRCSRRHRRASTHTGGDVTPRDYSQLKSVFVVNQGTRGEHHDTKRDSFTKSCELRVCSSRNPGTFTANTYATSRRRSSCPWRTQVRLKLAITRATPSSTSTE